MDKTGKSCAMLAALPGSGIRENYRAQIARHVEKIPLLPDSRVYIARGLGSVGGVAVTGVQGARIARCGQRLISEWYWRLRPAEMRNLRFTIRAFGARLRCVFAVDLEEGCSQC